MLFSPDDTVELPDVNAFTQIALTYGGTVYDAWYSPAMSQDILLVCAAKGDEQPAWYLLNLSLSTFTLYDTVNTRPATQPTTTVSTTTAPTTTRPTAGDVPADADAQIATLRIIVVALAAVVVVLLIVIIVMARAASANKRARH